MCVLVLYNLSVKLNLQCAKSEVKSEARNNIILYIHNSLKCVTLDIGPSWPKGLLRRALDLP